MKKLSNKILVLILVLLGAIFAVSRFFNAPTKESNLRKDLVKLDTAKITEVRILPASHHDEEIKLQREKGQWLLHKGKLTSVSDDGLVRSMLGMLKQVQPQRMVSHKKEKWDEFNVGEKGTHIVIFENSEKLADLVVGKTGFTPSSGGGFGGGYTYFRLTEEDDVYVVEGFFESAFNRAYNDWRNKSLVKIRKEDITKITFDYPLDSGFVVEKKDSMWYILQTGVKASIMENYLNRVSSQNMSEFSDDFVPSAKPDVIVRIDGQTTRLAQVECWRQNEKWILTSTQQKGVYFSGQDATVSNFLVGKKKLLRGDGK